MVIGNTMEIEGSTYFRNVNLLQRGREDTHEEIMSFKMKRLEKKQGDKMSLNQQKKNYILFNFYFLLEVAMPDLLIWPNMVFKYLGNLCRNIMMFYLIIIFIQSPKCTRNILHLLFNDFFAFYIFTFFQIKKKLF